MSFETVADILQIIFADIILSGDNALVIGMAAAGLAPEFRRRAIMIGMMTAAGMRIVFAVIASFLISIKGILLLGGVLLAWVCWRFSSWRCLPR
jgi:predicted tellurium resistance membrane protein TerC